MAGDPPRLEGPGRGRHGRDGLGGAPEAVRVGLLHHVQGRRHRGLLCGGPGVPGELEVLRRRRHLSSGFGAVSF